MTVEKELWAVCRGRRIVTGPHHMPEDNAKEMALRWNTFLVTDEYRALPMSEVKRIGGRPVEWNDG